MSLCRLYPLPSDRMAIMWSLMPIGNAICLEYGPAGTTHFGGGFYGSLGISLDKTLFTTHISEDDVIMGDVSRLEHAIVEIDEAYEPEVIFVVASAVISVIGTDIRGVCQYMQEKVKARLIAFEDGGFRGDYTFGLRSVYLLLAKELVKKKEVLPIEKNLPVMQAEKNQEMLQNEQYEMSARKPYKGSFSILGASAGSYRIRSDVWEIKSLMKEAFDYDCHMVMGLETTIEKIETAGVVDLNLVLRKEAVDAAEVIKEKCEVPYFYGAPYGYMGTLHWLQEISEMIGVPVNQELVNRLEEKAERLRPGFGGPMANFRKKEAIASIQGDFDTCNGLAYALQEMDITIDQKICSHSLKGIGDIEEVEKQYGIKAYQKEKERLELIRSLEDEWLLGSNEVRTVMGESNYFTLVSAPFVGKIQNATHLPFMGEKGMDFLLEKRDEYFEKIGI